MAKLTPDIKSFIDSQIKAKKPLNYGRLIKAIARRYGVRVSKATISRRAKALKVQFRPGRKRLVSVEKRPSRSIFLDCAGAFFLKGAELEMGLLGVMGELLATSTESSQARRALNLAQQINALLLYAPIFELKTAGELVDYNRRGLLYLAEEKSLPEQAAIEQYLHFLVDNKLLLLIIKEVTNACAEALFLRLTFGGQTFYLDAQTHTVWPAPKIPRYFSATLNRTTSYVKSTFLSPSPKQPLILQTCPGYTTLPSEMFNLIQCFEGAQEEPITQIVVGGYTAKPLKFWQNIQPRQRCYFLAPLSPWQYAQLQGTKIVQDFKQYRIGPEKEPMAVADAQVSLFNPQLSKNITLRAALVRRKEERLALITNISRREERYIRRIAEQYFSRWPDRKVKTYYDLMEEAHEEMLGRSQSPVSTTPFITVGYEQRPLEGFRLLLKHLHRYTLRRFFPSEYEKEDLPSMGEKVYRQPGFLRVKGQGWQILLRRFSSKKIQSDVQIACQRFNQSNIKFPNQKSLRIDFQ